MAGITLNPGLNGTSRSRPTIQHRPGGWNLDRVCMHPPLELEDHGEVGKRQRDPTGTQGSSRTSEPWLRTLGGRGAVVQSGLRGFWAFWARLRNDLAPHQQHVSKACANTSMCHFHRSGGTETATA